MTDDLVSEIQAPKKKNRTVQFSILLLKIAVTIFCFWYISTKIDFVKAGNAIQSANWFWLIIVILLLALSKIVSAYRLNIYFANIRLILQQKINLKLYWVGMFYNLFLPGAISGDAYKVILLNKKYKTSYKKVTAAVLLDRFSGLLALGTILSVFGIIVLDNNLYDVLLITGSVLAIITLYFTIRFLFKDFLPGFWPTFFLGLLVQGLQVVCIYCILLALNIPLSETAWIFIFLASAIITVLPISLGGGLGTRELIFLEGAKYFALDQHIAPVISILFYLASVIISIGGIYFAYHDPLKE